MEGRQASLFDDPPSQTAVNAHFDRERAGKRREEGVQLVAQTNKAFIDRMRAVAKGYAAANGSVHIDDLRRHALEIGIKPESSNAWGAIFREKGWRKVGYRASELVTNHGHVSPIWQYTKGD